MGPRSFDRGDLMLLLFACDTPRASMGPRSFDRGDPPLPHVPARRCWRFNGAAVL